MVCVQMVLMVLVYVIVQQMLLVVHVNIHAQQHVQDVEDHNIQEHVYVIKDILEIIVTIVISIMTESLVNVLVSPSHTYQNTQFGIITCSHLICHGTNMVRSL